MRHSQPPWILASAGWLAVALSAALAAGCTGSGVRSAPEESASHASSGTSESPGSLTREREAQLISEYEDRMVACFRDEGLEVAVGGEIGGGWQLEPGTSGGSTQDVMRRCNERIGTPQIAPPSPEEASQLYDLTLEMAACLEARGVEVSEPPSREAWVETTLADRPAWTPYDDAGAYTAANLAACPQVSITDIGSR